MALAIQPRPYRDFLTAALHKRFIDASFYTLALCYVVSLWMGGFSSYFWSWFPFGPAGVRTILLYIPAVTIFILRVAQWHVGHRNTQTPAETFTKYALRKATLITAGCYVLSAFFYGEVYIWSQSSEVRLSFTEQGKYHERFKLNERPLFLRYMFVALGLIQAGVHLWRDYDRIDVPAAKPRKERELATKTEPPARPRQVLVQMWKPMAYTAATIAIATIIAGTTVYFVAIRGTLWNYYFSFARRLVSLSKASKPTGLPPFFFLLAKFFVQAFWLTLIWQFVNKAFDLYISQEPLKKGQPITNESKDPNGSLLNGLKSKKDAVKAIAFWELALITDRFPERRKTIYGELERKKAATFKQVTEICLTELRLLISRISIALDPKYRPDGDKKAQPEPISLVPQIAQPLKEAPIKGPGDAPTTRMEKFKAVTASIAQAHSSPENVKNAYAREYLQKGQQKISEGAKEAESLWTTYFSKIVASPIGLPFRHSIRRTAALVVTGAPYSHISLICNAITTLTNLTVLSIKEDEFGRFQDQVPDIVRVFTAAIKKIEEYVAKLEIHWSDLDALARPEADRKKIPEVEEVKECLKDGLEKILGAFNEYLESMGMSRVELQQAKKSVSRGPEMAVAAPKGGPTAGPTTGPRVAKIGV